MKIVNLTPHTINFVDGEGRPLVTVEPSGRVARVTANTVTTGEVDVWADVFTTIHEVLLSLDGAETPAETVGIPITGTTYGKVEGLPDPEEGTIYVVSSLVASRVPNRTDVFIPNESVRDNQGRIIGCKSLGRV